MPAQLLVEHVGPAMIVTISNPGVRNALAPEMYGAFVDALRKDSKSDPSRVVILTGADGFFSAGGNLNRLRENRSKPPAVQADGIDLLHAMTRALADSPRPVIAAIEGAAAGAGLSLAMGCDLIVAGRSAKFVMAYVKVGLSPDGGGSWQAARALPRQAAAEMLLTGNTWSAARLMDLGVVNRVVEDGMALQAANKWAAEIAQLSPHAMARIKELLRKAADTPLREHLEAEKQSFVACLHHPEAGSAIDAFLNRRMSES